MYIFISCYLFHTEHSILQSLLKFSAAGGDTKVRGIIKEGAEVGEN